MLKQLSASGLSCIRFEVMRALAPLLRLAFSMQAIAFKDTYIQSHTLLGKWCTQVNSGAWSGEAYHEYQRMAASTGNVDSARLLLEYGFGPAIAEASTSGNNWPLHAAAATCDMEALKTALGRQVEKRANVS